MKIFLAGVGQANLAPMWKRCHNMILEGRSFDVALYEAMKLFLAESGGLWEAYFDKENFSGIYILQSFYYADEFTEQFIIPNTGDFLLDSGAFTFMQGNHKGKIVWEEYCDRYAEFIKRNNIHKYFELDIDSVVGYEKVKELRSRLERAVGWQSIPVWHKSRGITEYLKTCEEYEYTAIGGIVSKEIKPAEYKAFPKMIYEAHKRDCKVHGLGFTSLSLIPTIRFDSVDSTAWTTGNRFGYVYKFNGRTMEKIDCPKGKRLSDPRVVALVNYSEWIKFQKYAETHL